MKNPHNLDPRVEFKRAFEVAKFNPKMMKELSKDEGITRMAFLFLFLATFAGAVGSLLFPVVYNGVIYQPTILESLISVVETFVLALVFLYVINFIAEIFFGGKSGFMPFFRAVGYGYVVGLLYLVPALTILALIWIYLIMGKTLIEVKHLSVPQAVFTILISIVGIALLIVGFEMLNPGNLYGGFYVAPY